MMFNFKYSDNVNNENHSEKTKTNKTIKHLSHGSNCSLLLDKNSNDWGVFMSRLLICT